MGEWGVGGRGAIPTVIVEKFLGAFPDAHSEAVS